MSPHPIAFYGDVEEKRVRKIRFLQRMGFTIKEIEKLSSDSEDEVKRKLQERICSMREEISEKKELISKAEEILKMMEGKGEENEKNLLKDCCSYCSY